MVQLPLGSFCPYFSRPVHVLQNWVARTVRARALSVVMNKTCILRGWLTETSGGRGAAGVLDSSRVLARVERRLAGTAGEVSVRVGDGQQTGKGASAAGEHDRGCDERGESSEDGHRVCRVGVERTWGAPCCTRRGLYTACARGRRRYCTVNPLSNVCQLMPLPPGTRMDTAAITALSGSGRGRWRHGPCDLWRKDGTSSSPVRSCPSGARLIGCESAEMMFWLRHGSCCLTYDRPTVSCYARCRCQCAPAAGGACYFTSTCGCVPEDFAGSGGAPPLRQAGHVLAEINVRLRVVANFRTRFSAAMSFLV